MPIKNLVVKNFRTHDECIATLSPNTTVIIGKNGSGKTSLIEAIYIALQGSSFRGGDIDILKHHMPWYRIDIEFLDGSKRSIKFDSSKSTGKKQFIINNKINYRLLTKDKYPVVLFEPDDLRLLSGSPTRRRHFIDTLISQVDPQFHLAVRKYERALKQRNNLLKKPYTTNDELFVWNIALSEYGSYIISERVAFIEKLNEQISPTYTSISDSNDSISLHYSHTLIGDMKQKLLNELIAGSDKDKLLGFTTVGPHRHDIIFTLNNSNADSVASRGENRTIILTLKLLEAKLIEQITNIKPIILLDDVYSELDETRQNNISETHYQTIITSTNALRNTNSTVIRT